MTQLMITIEDPSKVSTISSLLQMIEGVKVTLPKKKRKTGIDLAYEDVAAGRVTRYNSFSDFMNAPHLENDKEKNKGVRKKRFITPLVASLAHNPPISLSDEEVDKIIEQHILDKYK